jgi:hypothetical protein
MKKKIVKKAGNHQQKGEKVFNQEFKEAMVLINI